jgi:hypothetical protein
MKIVVTRIALTLIAIGIACAGFAVRACTCAAQSSPYQEYQESRAVFLGEVTGSKDIAVAQQVGDKTLRGTARVFQFSVSESLKGLKTTQVEISAGWIDSTCYQGFTIGESYLVYAYGDSEKNLAFSSCGRTNNLSSAADDLHYIRDLMRGVPEPRVYGSVMRLDASPSGSTATPRVSPTEGIKILIEGKGKNFEAVTDKQGLFSLARLPDGKYKAHPLLPKKYRTYFPAEEEFILGSQEEVSSPRVQRGSTAYARFHIGWNNELSGRVLDSEGNAVVRAKVAVLLARDPAPLIVLGDHYAHRPEGKFEFYGLNPARYLLAVDIRAPFADPGRPTRFYYPGAAALDQASAIMIGESETIEDRDFRLPPGYLVRQIEGVLVWPNGVPVSGGWVFIAAAKDSADEDKQYDWGRTDELGRFSLQAFVGVEYWVHASSNSSGKGEPVKVKVGKTNEPLKVVIPFPKPLSPEAPS